MIEKTTYTGHNGYLAMDEVSNQGIFCYYYPPAKKVVLYEVYKDKKGDLNLAYPGFGKKKEGRKNLNVNLRPTVAKEVMEIIGVVAGVKVEETPTKVAESAEVSTKATLPQEGAQVDLKKAIGKSGV